MEWYYVIPIIYLFLLLVVGFMIMKKQNTRADFYVASNKMDGSVLFATVMSTVVGANTYMGFSGMVYSNGLSNMWLLSGAGLAYFVLFFISGKIRMIATKHEVYTLPDMVAIRYSQPVAVITTVFSLVGLVGGVGGGLRGLGIILNSLLNIPVTVAIIITSIVTIIYTTMGGLWGVSLTDWIQSIIMIFGLAICVIFGITAVTGQGFIAGSFNLAQTLQVQLGAGSINPVKGVTFFLVLAWTITFMPLNTISQTQIQRVYAAKDVKTMRTVCLLMIIFVAILMTTGLSLIGILGKATMPGLDNPEAVFPLMSMEVIHPVIGIMIVTGIMGAAMSTVDSNLLGSAMHVSRDIYERYMNYQNREIDDQRGIYISRVTIVIIGFISTFAAIYTPSIMNLLLVTMKIFAGATFAPVIIGLYWEKANAKGALLGEILGGGGVILANTTSLVSLDPVIFGIILAIFGVVVGSLLSKGDREKAVTFSFSTGITTADIKRLLLVAAIFILWAIGMNVYAAWPYIIITVVTLISFSILFLIYYFIKARRT